MATKTLYVDSRTRIRGKHADFSISLPEAMTRRGARLFVDAIRTTNTFPTVSSRNRYVYFLNGSGLSAIALAPGAYMGATFAAELDPLRALMPGLSSGFQCSASGDCARLIDGPPANGLASG